MAHDFMYILYRLYYDVQVLSLGFLRLVVEEVEEGNTNEEVNCRLEVGGYDQSC